MSSLGWLTESAFLPKESKKINVGQNSSLVDLKAKILEEKAKLTKKATGQGEGDLTTQLRNKRDRKEMEKLKAAAQSQNKGIEDRMRRDEEQEAKNPSVVDAKGIIDHRQIELKLAEKAQIYEQLTSDKKAHERGKSHLVDYEMKRWQGDSKK